VTVLSFGRNQQKSLQTTGRHLVWKYKENQPNYECRQLFYLLPGLWERGWAETGGKANVMRRIKTKRFYRTTHFRINLLSDVTIG
jgi:hypothetical protein